MVEHGVQTRGIKHRISPAQVHSDCIACGGADMTVTSLSAPASLAQVLQADIHSPVVSSVRYGVCLFHRKRLRLVQPRGLRSVERFDVETSTWNILAPLQVCAVPLRDQQQKSQDEKPKWDVHMFLARTYTKRKSHLWLLLLLSDRAGFNDLYVPGKTKGQHCETS
eukprot:506213-Amphidinium_carterae.2